MAQNQHPLVAALSPIPELKNRFESYDLGHPLVGSLEYEDRLAGWGGDGPGSQASIRLSDAVDHLMAWYLLASPPEPTLPVHAHLTLLRPALELAVQSRWLLDASVDPATRIARALGVRLDDLEWVRKVDVDLEAETAEADPSLGPIPLSTGPSLKTQAVQSKAAAAGVTPIQMLDTVSLLKNYPQQSGWRDVIFWRISSGVLHGQAWAAMLVDREVVQAGATMTSYKNSANEGLAADLTDLAVRHVDRAVSDLLQYVEPPTQPV